MILYDIVRDEERSVVVVTQDSRVEDLADRILWLEDGELRDRKSEQHIWVRDPVCNMRIDEWAASVFTEYESERYVFCLQRCLKRFRASPDRYSSRPAGR